MLKFEDLKDFLIERFELQEIFNLKNTYEFYKETDIAYSREIPLKSHPYIFSYQHKKRLDENWNAVTLNLKQSKIIDDLIEFAKSKGIEVPEYIFSQDFEWSYIDVSESLMSILIKVDEKNAFIEIAKKDSILV